MACPRENYRGGALEERSQLKRKRERERARPIRNRWDRVQHSCSVGSAVPWFGYITVHRNAKLESYTYMGKLKRLLNVLWCGLTKIDMDNV